MIRLIRDRVPSSVLTLLLSDIILIVSCYVLASYIALEVDPTVFLLYDSGLARIAIVVSSIVAGVYLHDLYTHIRVRSKTFLFQQICQVVGIAFLIQALLSYLQPDWVLPRWLMMLGGVLCLVALPPWRILYAIVILRAMRASTLLFLGTNHIVRDIAGYLETRQELGLRVLGYVDDELPEGTVISGAPVLGPLESLRDIVREEEPERIVVGMKERRQRMPVLDLLDMRFSGIIIEEAAKTYEAMCGRISVKELRPAQLIFSGELGPRPRNVTFQSLYSYLAALAGAIIASPLMLLVAIAVKLTSPGPVLFRQKRVGRHDVPFVLYKFRSMTEDAEAESGAVWAKKDDPRVTPLGRWLRRLRLDELPQFFNVLRGEMSIVGPRPERPEFVKTLAEEIPYYRQRHWVKPGITGWAQISHKYGDTLEDTISKLEYDLYYIKNLSPALDAFILFHTMKTMLLSRGSQ